MVEEKKGNQKETTVNSLDSKVFEDIAERWEKKRQEKDIWCRLIPLNPSLSVCEFVKGRGSLCEKVVGTKESCDVILKNDECAEKQCALLLIGLFFIYFFYLFIYFFYFLFHLFFFFFFFFNSFNLHVFYQMDKFILKIFVILKAPI